ncbi:hypothetical protein, partial [Arthrobacter sp. Bi26]|uniref:hypothetical protein n=1 Tax=Arthrobacter sp. Bi26 TaxID=2822350 RepID=UPI001E4D0206
MTKLDRLSSMRGRHRPGVWLCRFFRFCCVGHELVNACRVRLGGFERIGVLEGFRQCLICLSDARPGTVHTAIERVVRLGGWRQLFSCGT